MFSGWQHDRDRDHAGDRRPRQPAPEPVIASLTAGSPGTIAQAATGVRCLAGNGGARTVLTVLTPLLRRRMLRLCLLDNLFEQLRIGKHIKGRPKDRGCGNPGLIGHRSEPLVAPIVQIKRDPAG